MTALCDSCANYSKMNSLRGLNSANSGGAGGGGGLPDRSAASRRAEGGGGRRVSANVSWSLGWSVGQSIRLKGCVSFVFCRGCVINFPEQYMRQY